jgi:hypothetical protein
VGSPSLAINPDQFATNTIPTTQTIKNKIKMAKTEAEDQDSTRYGPTKQIAAVRAAATKAVIVVLDTVAQASFD